MAWSAQRPAVRRRVVLGLDCLEDRFAPAAFALFGQSTSDIVPISARVELDATAAGRFAVAAPVGAFSAAVNAARLDDVPFGFFHPFCQNGFGGNDAMMEEAPLPQLRPVVPPLAPALIFPEPDWFDAAIPAAPAAPPAGNESTGPVFELPPVILRVPTPERLVAPREQPAAQQTDEPTFRYDFADDSEPVRPANTNSRNGLAAMGGLMAAFGLLYTRNARERRYDDAPTFGH